MPHVRPSCGTGACVREPLLRRAAVAASSGLPGFGTAWFGPGTPLPAASPPVTPPRLWDYPSGINLHRSPRQTEGISVAQLRALADNCTLVRLAIETRKAQATRLMWSLGWDDTDREDDLDPEARDIARLLIHPDGRQRLRPWMKAEIEDLLVLDASARVADRNRGGRVTGIRLLDGGTIVPRIDESGQESLDGTAYQQIIKGIVAADFTRDELVYTRLNPRTNHLYGHSPVAQVALIANLCIRRELSQLQYFTEGTVPQVLVSMPESWSATQIREFQVWWDAQFEGNQAALRKLKIIPGGAGQSITQLKPDLIKSEMDEWLARVVSYAFSLPPTWAVRQMNRASAEAQQDAALEEGQLPFIEDLADIFAECFSRFWGRDDLAFRPNEPRKSDPSKQAEIRALDVQHGVISINEARADLGRKPIDGLDIPTIQTPAGLIPVTAALAAPMPAADGDVIDVTPEPQRALPAPEGGASASGNVQQQALNGTQISGLLEIVAAVSAGELEPAAAVQIILVSFPTIEESRAQAIVAGAIKQEPEPVPAALVPGAPADAANGADAPAADTTTTTDAADDTPPGDRGLGKTAQPARPRRFVAGLSRKQRRLLAGGQRDSKPVVAIRTRYAAEVHAVLTSLPAALAAQVEPALLAAHAAKAQPTALRKLDEEAVAAAKAVADLQMDGFAVLVDPTQRTLAEVGRMGAEQAIANLRAAVPDLDAFTLPNDTVVAYARDRAAELVGKRVLADGSVIDNPNPEYAITESTRDLIRADVTQAFADGLSREELAAKLADSYAFSEERADLIARTEIGRALVNGNTASWKASGVVTGKTWLLGSEHDTGDICDDNEAAGEIGIDDDFPSGDDAPPAHPACVCDLQPIVGDDAGASDDTGDDDTADDGEEG